MKLLDLLNLTFQFFNSDRKVSRVDMKDVQLA